MFKIGRYLVLFCWSVNLLGQDKFYISYGESIKFNQEFNHYQFIMDRLTKTYSFEELRQYKFNQPGAYKIYSKNIGIAHSHTKNCNHEEDDFKLPDSFTVYVDSVHIEFIPSSLTIAKPIYKKQTTDGNSIQIEAIIKNYYRHPIQMNLSPVHTAGIGTKIIAILDDSMKVLNSGSYLLRYYLHGICEEASYIQFDFLDHVGNHVPIGLNQPIKE